MMSRRIDYEEEAGLFLDEYLTKMGNSIGPPVPIEQMVETLSGFDILYESEELAESESGRIDFNKELITIRDDEIEPRQRFSLAHEAGHLRLHAHKIDLVTTPIPGLFGDRVRSHLSRRGSNEWHEVEANKFAAAVLMPLSLLRPALEDAKEKFNYLSQNHQSMIDTVQSYLAAQFQVSNQAMGFRLKNIGFVAELFTPRLF
jgi:Zn-dependent peptidase ImmA (M78 family)